jgi:hypothetical protein
MRNLPIAQEAANYLRRARRIMVIGCTVKYPSDRNISLRVLTGKGLRLTPRPF